MEEIPLEHFNIDSCTLKHSTRNMLPSRKERTDQKIERWDHLRKAAV
jgi:hypothetical protein